MKTLLIVAHGSRHPDSDREIRALVDAVRARATDQYARVTHAYLELATPDIPSALAMLKAGGATAIDLLPYFLARGNHVAADVPAIVDQFRAANPQLMLRLLSHIGAAPDMADYVLAHVRHHNHGKS